MKRIFLILLFATFSFGSVYSIGDTVNIEDQNIPLNICYGENEGSTVSLSDSRGKVILLGIDATW